MSINETKIINVNKSYGKVVRTLYNDDNEEIFKDR